MAQLFSDSWAMFTRCMRVVFRSPDAVGMAIIAPAFLMWLFANIFGNIIDVGEINYINFIVPGIILQAVTQATTAVAISVNNDMSRGIIDRFRSMAITRSSVLIGHVFASVVRNIFTTAIIIGVGIAVGVRPQAGFVGWLVIAGVMILSILAFTWIAVICGLLAKSPESAGAMMFPLFLLPFVSSGFAPTETMTRGLRWFSTHQPMTHIIDTVRNLMLDLPLGNEIWLALAWSVGITIAAFVVAVQLYKRKLA